MGLSEIDRQLLQRCLERHPGAWEDFADRFLGLVVHVVNHTAQSRSVRLQPDEVNDLAHEVFLTIFEDDLAVLRRFRGKSSLAPYLTVVARRVVVRELLKRPSTTSLRDAAQQDLSPAAATSVEQRISDRDEVERLLDTLSGSTAEVVRMYHLDGLSYREISAQTGVAENSIGPTLSRARAKMRQTPRPDE